MCVNAAALYKVTHSERSCDRWRCLSGDRPSTIMCVAIVWSMSSTCARGATRSRRRLSGPHSTGCCRLRSLCAQPRGYGPNRLQSAMLECVSFARIENLEVHAVSESVPPRRVLASSSMKHCSTARLPVRGPPDVRLVHVRRVWLAFYPDGLET